MNIGPFFYFKDKISNIQGLYADLVNINDITDRTEKLDSPVGHQELFDRLKTKEDYIFFPRGRVVYDTGQNVSIIYIDKCIMKQVPKVVETFQLENYRVETNDHYTCRGCGDTGEMWD